MGCQTPRIWERPWKAMMSWTRRSCFLEPWWVLHILGACAAAPGTGHQVSSRSWEAVQPSGYDHGWNSSSPLTSYLTFSKLLNALCLSLVTYEMGMIIAPTSELLQVWHDPDPRPTATMTQWFLHHGFILKRVQQNPAILRRLWWFHFSVWKSNLIVSGKHLSHYSVLDSCPSDWEDFFLFCLFCFFNAVFRNLMEQFHFHLAK